MVNLVANDIKDSNYEDILNGMSTGEKVRLSIEAEREMALRSTWYLGFNILGYDWLDSKFHPALAQFLDNNWLYCQLHLHPRGHLKTTLLTICATIRRILQNPNHTEGICANTDENASKMLQGAKSHFIENEKFRDVFPEHATKSAAEQGTTEKFTTPARTKKWITEASIECFSVKKAAVSRHYEHITFEDIQDAKNSRTLALRDEVYRVYGESLSLLNPHPDTNRIWYHIIGTRWHHDDVYGRVLKQIKRRGNKDNIKPLITRYEKNGELLFPERRTWDYFEEMLERQKSYIFSCQYCNQPIRDDDRDFDVTELNEYDYEEGKNPFEGSFNRYMLVDPGGWTERAGIVDRDKCAIGIYDVDTEGNIYVRKVYNEILDPDGQQDKIFEAYKKWRPREIGIESMAWQKALCFYVDKRMKKENLKIRITEIKRGVQSKQERIRRLPSYVSSGCVYIPVYPNKPKYQKDRQAINTLVAEMDEFPTGQSDDILDTMADLIEIMNVPRKPKRRKINYRMPSRMYSAGRRFGTGYSYAANE